MGLLDRIERLKEDNQKWEQGDINAAQVGVRTAGETVGALGDVVEPVVPAASWLNEKAKALNPVQSTLSDAVAPFFKEAIQAVMDDAKNSPMYKIGEKYIKDHPELARDVAMGANAMALLPGGAMLKTGKKMATYGDEALKGGTLSNVSNFIPNHYAPERMPTSTEQLFGKGLEKAAGVPVVDKVASKVMPGGVSGTGVDAAAMKLTSFGTHAIDAVGDMLGHKLSPTSRANYGENAVSSGSQRHVRNELAKHKTPVTNFKGEQGTYNRAGEKGVAQVMYGSHHIPEQAGRVGAVHPAVQEINQRAFITDPQPATRETLRDTFSSMGHKVDKDRASRSKKMDHNDKGWAEIEDVGTAPQDSDFAARYIMDKQEVNPNTKFVVKAPSNIESGGHFSDVVHKNPANEAVANVFKKYADADGNVNLETLFNELEGVRDAANAKLKKAGRLRDGWRVVNKDLDHVKKNGLWLAGGKGGSAVTEGGVMWLQKLEPNGNTTTWMVDKHDFLEKAAPPGLMEKLLPNDMIAVTPPMKGNIKEQRVIKRKGKKLTPEEHFQQTRNRKNWQGEQPTREGGLLEQYANIMPSKRNINAERLKLGGRAAQLGGLLYAGDN